MVQGRLEDRCAKRESDFLFKMVHVGANAEVWTFRTYRNNIVRSRGLCEPLKSRSATVYARFIRSESRNLKT